MLFYFRRDSYSSVFFLQCISYRFGFYVVDQTESLLSAVIACKFTTSLSYFCCFDANLFKGY